MKTVEAVAVAICIIAIGALGLVNWLGSSIEKSVGLPVYLPFVVLAFFASVKGVSLRSLVNVSRPVALALSLLIARILFEFIRGDYYDRVEALRMLGLILTSILLYSIGIISWQKKNLRHVVLLSIATSVVCTSCVSFAELLRGAPAPWSIYEALKEINFGGDYGRPAGLDVNPISFGGWVSWSCCLLSGCVLGCIRGVDRRMSLLATSSGLLGLLAVSSRSALLGAALGIVLMLVFSKGRGVVLLLVLACAVAVSLPFSGEALDHLAKRQSASEDGRLGDNWRVYAPVVITNPVGDFIQGESERVKGIRSAQKIFPVGVAKGSEFYHLAPHNSLLICGIKFGWIGVFCYLLVYVHPIVNVFARSFEIKTLASPSLSVAIAILVGQFVHAWFHNSNALNGDFRAWLGIGFSMAILAENARRSPRTD